MSIGEVAKCAGGEQDKPQKFLMLFIIGIFIIFVGIITLIIAAVISGEGSANFGGVIFIWFIPIVFGAGPESQWMVLFAVILAILSIVMLLLMHSKKEKSLY
ncbi:MAG: DUF131 domain-containing protein [Candidatus Bathyarchaeia archaeon]